MIRLLLRDACEHLQRTELTYLGLPAEEALDLKLLSPFIQNAICVDDRLKVLEETQRSIASLPLRVRRFKHGKMWQYLRDKYPSEPLVADITFLDFYGGGIVNDDPFAVEIAGLRSYFAKQALHSNKAFVLAWTYMPRDKGKQIYIDVCEKFVQRAELEFLRRSSSLWLRSIVVRYLLRQSLLEHEMSCKIFHHAVYKKTMNAIIVLFSKGYDKQCRISLGDPDSLLREPVFIYEPKRVIPKIVPFPIS